MLFPRFAAWLICFTAPLISAMGGQNEFKSLFNGTDLTGWDGDPRYWKVAEGVIRGESTFKALPLSNTFLLWRDGILKDFELRLKFRISSGNSGIQYRSRDLGNWAVAGYQAEIENKQGKVGLLYEEKGRKFLANVGERVEMGPGGERRVLSRIASNEELIGKGYYKEKEWNDYTIIARGNHLEQWLNGIKIIELTDNDTAHRALDGILALQIHAGPPMRVEFKNIFLRTL
ncbi:MAG: rane-bound dehydrogenase domain protein [Chthoniobacteraceae bacterium]|nr:rane-bound dehydrogenase domain protein [Chthoniobacteraceae bacterium]